MEYQKNIELGKITSLTKSIWQPESMLAHNSLEKIHLF
jgi:hypothetical protein